MNTRRYAQPPATREVLGAAWRVYLREWKPLLGATLILMLITQVPFAIFLMGPLYVGLSSLCLAAAHGKPVKFDRLFDQSGPMADSLIAGAIYSACAMIPTAIFFSLAVVLGMLALIEERLLEAQLIFTFGMGLSLLPLAAVVLLYTPTFFFLADGEAGWRTAMGKSEKLVRAHWAAWTALWAVLGLAHLAGTLACCLPGIFITPWMGVAVGMLYDRLRETSPAPASAPSAPQAPPPIPGAR